MLSYERIRRKQNDDTFWTSYSDLATVLSILFLTLYVVATLHTTAVSVLERQGVAEAKKEVEALKEQVRAYEVLKEDYVANANTAETKMYDDLLSQMTLLERGALEEKEKLMKQAAEANEKEASLNRYQKIIKGVIESNMIARKEITKRDKTIEQKNKGLSDLRKSIQDKEKKIAQNRAEIAQIQKNLEVSVYRLNQTKRQSTKAKEALRANIQRLQKESATRVASLRLESQRAEEELKQTQNLVQQKSKQLAQTQSQLQSAEEERENAQVKLEKEREEFQQSIHREQAEHEARMAEEQNRFEESLKKEKLSAQEQLARERKHLEKVEQEKAEYDTRMKGLSKQLKLTREQIASQGESYQEALRQLREDHESKLAEARGLYEKSLSKEKLSGQEQLARERDYRSKVEAEKNAYNSRVQGLSSALEQSKVAAVAQGQAYQGKIRSLSSENQGMQKELVELREREEQRKELARRIQENFAKGGVSANINPKTGEALINFGEEYFDTGKSSLKEGMRKVLERALPLYAKSILQDKNLADKIASVEIVGFASPTFKGAYVNPRDLSAEAKRAVDYNMDLSYQRAKSIFDYVFKPDQMEFPYRKELLPLVKVTGQGYLKAEGAKGDKPLSGEEYCTRYDCTKAQKVVIKFHFKE